MKVYIYDDGAGTMHAITETGERLMHHVLRGKLEAERRRAARLEDRSDVPCPKCGGAEWVWGHELDVDPDHVTDQRYPCDECERLMHHDSSEQSFTQDDVLTFRDSLNQFYSKKYRMKMLWVPAEAVPVHPVLSKLLAQEARAAEEEAEPAAGGHLCHGCAHELVCVGRREAETIGFTITACEQHVALPNGEDHE